MQLPAFTLAVLVFGSAGCGTPYSARERVSLTAGGRVDKIVITNGVGDIDVYCEAETAEVCADVIKVGRASSQGGADRARDAIKVALTPKRDEPGTLLATVEHPPNTAGRRHETQWTVTAPAGVAVEATSKLGDVEVCGFNRPAVLESDLGDLTARGMAAGLRGRTSLGDIRIEAGGAIDVRTDLGEINVDVLGGQPGPVTVHSNLGDIQVRLPTNRRGRLVTSTDLGTLRLRLEGMTMTTIRQQGRHFDAELGGSAEPALNVTTDLGDVTVTSYPADSGPKGQ